MERRAPYHTANPDPADRVADLTYLQAILEVARLIDENRRLRRQRQAACELVCLLMEGK